MPDYSNSLRVPVRCACCGSNAENRGEARHDEGSDEGRHERNRKADQVSFLYTDEIDTERIVSIKADSKPLNEVLPLLFKDTDITYEITVPNIVLSKRVSAARPSAISGVVKDSGGLGIIGATVLIKGRPSERPPVSTETLP